MLCRLADLACLERSCFTQEPVAIIISFRSSTLELLALVKRGCRPDPYPVPHWTPHFERGRLGRPRTPAGSGRPGPGDRGSRRWPNATRDSSLGPSGWERPRETSSSPLISTLSIRAHPTRRGLPKALLCKIYALEYKMPVLEQQPWHLKLGKLPPGCSHPGQTFRSFNAKAIVRPR